MKTSALILFLVVCLTSLLTSCYNPVSSLDRDLARYKKVKDFQYNTEPIPFDYAFVARDTALTRDKKVMYYEASSNGVFTILDKEIDTGDTVTLNWSGNGEFLYITIIKKLSNDNFIYEFNTTTKQLSALPIITELHYAPIYKVDSNYDGSFLIYLPRDNDRTPEDLCYDRKTSSVKKLSTFLTEKNQLTRNPNYWFFQPSDSNLLDYHTHFVRWEHTGELILRRNFYRKSDTARVSIMYNYKIETNEVAVVDSAISVPDTYRFNSDFYYEYSNDTQQFYRVQKSNQQKVSRNEVFTDNHYINYLVELPEHEKVLIQQTKRITASLSGKRVKLMNYETNRLTKVLPNIQHVIFSDIHTSSQRLFFECYFNYGNAIVIIMTDYEGENPVIISDRKYQINWFRIRPKN